MKHRRHFAEEHPHLTEGLKTIAGMAVINFAVRGLHIAVRSRSDMDTIATAEKLRERLERPTGGTTATAETLPSLPDHKRRVVEGALDPEHLDENGLLRIDR